MCTALAVVALGCTAPGDEWERPSEGLSDHDGGFDALRPGPGTWAFEREGDADVDGDADTDPEPEDTGPHLSTANDYVAIEGDLGMVCATHADGSVDCWGDWSTHIDGPVTDVSIFDYNWYVAWTDTEGTVWYRSEGSSEDGTWNSLPPPSRLISVGGLEYGGCSVTLDGALQCWSYWGDGRCEDFGSCLEPEGWPEGEMDIQDMEYSGAWGCALRGEGSVVCWGAEGLEFEDIPDERFVKVGFGYGLTESGEVREWSPLFDASYVPDEGPYIDCYAGAGICALRADGTADCRAPHDRLTYIPADEPFVSLTEPGYASCGVRMDGRVQCFAEQTFGDGASILRVP